MLSCLARTTRPTSMPSHFHRARENQQAQMPVFSSRLLWSSSAAEQGWSAAITETA